MKDQKNKNAVWVGVEELNNETGVQNLSDQEFHELPIVDQLSEEEVIDTKTNRRDFLKYLGFGLGAATVAASCDIPVKHAIPYVTKPDQIVPGVANYYASSFVNGGDYCAVLVKTREGRPIKIEGNTLSGVTKGGTSARAQASVLGLYDTNRFQNPGTFDGTSLSKMSWDEIDQEVTSKLNAGSVVRIVTHTNMSPTTKKAIEDFTAVYPNTEVVTYDPVSSSALLSANEQSFGVRAVPDYHFDKADVIVSLGADFLGTWISPTEYAKAYAENRKITDASNPKMSHHIQVESHMSLTGSNADNRILVRPSEMGAAIVALYKEVAALTGGTSISGPSVNDKAGAGLKEAAKKLVAAQGKSLVVSGSNNIGEQILVNAINDMLGNYGATLDFTHASNQRQGNDQHVKTLIGDMNKGAVNAVFVMGANPCWDLPNADVFSAAFAKVGLKVTFANLPDETASACDYVAPNHHFLESWGDVEPKKGHYSLVQPTITPLFNTRQAEESLLRWANSPNFDAAAEQPYYNYLKANWEANMFPAQSSYATFQSFWDSALHDGVVSMPQAPVSVAFGASPAAAAAKVSKPSNAELEIAFFETVNLGHGQYANNPWLQEMPDPVARTTWGNYLAIPVGWEGGNSYVNFKGLNMREHYGEADIVDVTVDGSTNRFTCVAQFGLAPNTVSLALGYGRNTVGLSGKEVGANVNPWCWVDAEGNFQYYAVGAEVSDKVETEGRFACVQYHHTMGVTGTDPETNEEINVDEKTVMTLGSGYQGGLTERSIIYQANMAEVPELIEKIKEKRDFAKHLNDETLYPFEEYNAEFYSQGHHWGMYVDLNACIGCGACQVACVSENNVPVVGKLEVARHHEMTWLRIDRYFYGDYENPNVVYQPMMCQHCDNAPCENVCPVAATNHSSEGLNQMTYNRCIGTRYCANNCPYKVRRFNWLDYTTADIFPVNEVPINGEETPYGADNLTRMVLNPDVTVRSRGVIEKCSFCVQRIQEGKLTAKRESRKLMDSDVRTACQTACPTGAITFGDLNNHQGDLHGQMDSPLNYRVLEETNTQSSVYYSAKVNNRDEAIS
ncbi:MAG: TAT-variant-translocated molybdopterin oxidoreductase [Bacteroidetes bacterium]|nr:TAT-variant-translocated molybdopterin oxidoreductase [Bacteroidota bacterium]